MRDGPSGRVLGVLREKQAYKLARNLLKGFAIECIAEEATRQDISPAIREKVQSKSTLLEIRSQIKARLNRIPPQSNPSKRGTLNSRERRCVGAGPDMRSPGKPLMAVFIRSFLLFGHSVLLGRYFNLDSNKKQENANASRKEGYKSKLSSVAKLSVL
jgi:hypothetical protein